MPKTKFDRGHVISVKEMMTFCKSKNESHASAML